MSTGRERKIPVTVITGFLGAGKTTLVRHVLEHAAGRRIAIIVNEFGALGVDGTLLTGCGIPGCDETTVYELANGCLCCTVADEFVPTMETLLAAVPPPEHIIIETSGLALPKPLLKAFGWPGLRTSVTVDGVIAVVDGPAVAAKRFADDPAAVSRQRAEDASVDHDNPLAEVYEDQIGAADLIVLNKADLLDAPTLESLTAEILTAIPRAVKVVAAREARVDPAVLLGLGAAAEGDLDSRKSRHDAVDGAHEHDDFESFVVELPELPSLDPLLARVAAAVERHAILRVKGVLALAGRPMRAVVQGVGGRLRSHFDRPFRPGEARRGQLVFIGQTGLDREAIAMAILG